MAERRYFLAASLTVAALLLAGCGGPAASASPGATGTVAPTATGGSTPVGSGPTTVNVVVQEFSVNPSVSTAASGDITFIVANAGPDDLHEFVVIKTDLEPDALPTDANGAVDEEGEGMTVIGEIEDIAVGATPQVTLSLEPGTYAFICNIWDPDEQEAHYSLGMYTGFTVTQ